MASVVGSFARCFSARFNGLTELVAGDAVVDAWAFYAADGQLDRVEVSTKRDGAVDRWEYYENGRMVRVETDTDGDGQVDTWSTYVNGILSSTTSDADGDGQPDRRETDAVGGR